MNTADLTFEAYYAAKQNDLAELKELFADMGKPNPSVRPYNQSLLLHAALNGSYEVAEYLIENGFEVNEQDEEGLTPLFAAAEYGFSDLALLLLKNGANPEIADYKGNTPLSRAVFNARNDLSMIKTLTENGANPWQKDQYGSSPYDLANKLGKKNISDYFDSVKR